MNSTGGQKNQTSDKTRLIWPLSAVITGSLCGMFAGTFALPRAIPVLTPQATASTPAGNEQLRRQNPTLDEKDIEKVLALFKAEQTGSEEKPAARDLAETSLPLRLVGTIFTGDSLTGTASIEKAGSGKVGTFYVGDFLSPDVQLIGVLQKKCIIKNAGRYETLTLKTQGVASGRSAKRTRSVSKSGASPRVKPVSDPRRHAYAEEGLEVKDGRIRLTGQKRDHLLTKLPEILQGALATPHMVDGQIAGWTLTKIKPDSIFAQLGLRDGDVVEEINGMKLSDAAQALKILSGARTAPTSDIRINRQGVSYDLKLEVL